MSGSREPAPGADRSGSARVRLAGVILALALERAPDRTICPSEAARAVGGTTWRDTMPLVRDVTRDLARQGLVEVTQRGAVLDPEGVWRGPVRIRHLGA